MHVNHKRVAKEVLESTKQFFLKSKYDLLSLLPEIPDGDQRNSVLLEIMHCEWAADKIKFLIEGLDNAKDKEGTKDIQRNEENIQEHQES